MHDEDQPETGEPEVTQHAEDEEQNLEEPATEAATPNEEVPDAEDEVLAAPKLERLQKILAQAGVASRRHAEELIKEGRVQVNGQIVTELGTKADPLRDHIRVDGKLLHGAERLRYFMLNKPKGYVTTVKDPEGRPTVMEFFSKTGERLYPVGRLDYLSEGLLLVTNDGELANKLTRAASGVEKTYLVKVSGQPTEEELETLRGGVSIQRGKPGEGRVRTAPARIRQVRQGENPWYEVVLIEGRNRELRKMFEEIGHFVEKIRRVGYGPLVLDLEPGKLRELDPEELAALRQAAEGKLKPRRLKTTRLLPKEAGRAVSHEPEARSRWQGGRGRKPFQQRREAPQTPKRDVREQTAEGRPERRTFGGKPGVKPFRREERPEATGTETGRRRERPARFGERPPRSGARPGQFGPKAGGARPFREEGREQGAGPRFERPARGERPRRSTEEFSREGRERKPFRPREERPVRFGKGPEERGGEEGRRKSFGPRPPGKGGPRPGFKGGPRPEFKGKGKAGTGSKPAPGGRGKSGFGAKQGGFSKPKSGFKGRPGGGPQRGGSRPGGSPGGGRRRP